MTIDELRARLAAATDELRTIHTEAGDGALSEEQQARWDAAEAEERDAQAALDEAEARAARDAAVAERRARWGSTQVAPVRSDPFDLSTMRGLTADETVARARAAFEDAATRGHGGSDEAAAEVLRKVAHLSNADDGEQGGQGAELARYALIHGSQAYRSAFRATMRAAWSGQAPILSGDEAAAMRASMSLTSANGGYALPTLLDPSLIRTGTASKNPIRRISRVEQGTQDKWNGVTVSAVTTAWKAEGSAFTDGSPTTGTVQIDAALLSAYVTGSYEIFADSNLFGQLPGLIGEAMDYAEGAAFVSGSGSDAPLGVVTAVSGTAGSLVTVTTRGTFNTGSAVDTLALYNALPIRYEDSATWVMNKATYLTVDQQVASGTDGTKVVDLRNRGELFGLPLVRASALPSATTSGNILAVLGDFQQFIVYDRLGMNVEIVQNVVDGDGLPVGKRGLLAHKRVGSGTSDVNAFRLLKA